MIRAIGPRLAVAGALIGLAAVSCRSSREAQGIVLVTLDTTRADRVGCYGNAQAVTPVLDALAAEGARFAQAGSPVPVTLPSHASMFTGRYPPVHGVRYNGMYRLPAAATTVAELLQSAGFATGAIPAASPVAASTGLAQGFGSYDDRFLEQPEVKGRTEVERRAQDVTNSAIEWIKSAGPRRFFLWVHYYDPHAPYEPPFPFSSQFRDHPYDGEIAYVDRELGRLVQFLKGEHLWDRVAFVVAGDHGEGLWDHGEKLHGYLAYQSTLAVPLIVRIPGGGRGRVVEEPVSLVDVAPTLLALSGVAIPSGLDGISLLPVFSGHDLPRRDLYFESLVGSLTYGWSPLTGIRRGRFKLIRSVAPELYDLEADPAEAANAYESDRGVASDLDAQLTSAVLRFTREGAAPETVAAPFDPDQLQRLLSLGYVGGAVVAERVGAPSPRELIHLEGDVTGAGDLMRAGQYEAALGLWKRILREDPGNLYASLNAAIAAAKLKRLDEGLSYAKGLVARVPDLLPAAITLSEVQIARGDFDAAVAALRDGLSHHPKDVGVMYRLGMALVARGSIDEASQVIDDALALDTEGGSRPSLLVARALCRAKRKDAAGADDALREAIAAGYRDREVLDTEPLLAPLRKTPGFREIVNTIPAKTR